MLSTGDAKIEYYISLMAENFIFHSLANFA